MIKFVNEINKVYELINF